jgi:hypothetical protein
MVPFDIKLDFQILGFWKNDFKVTKLIDKKHLKTKKALQINEVLF